MFCGEPERQACYEDSTSFLLAGVRFTIDCRVTSDGISYHPHASKDGRVAQAQQLPPRHPFHSLTFVNPPAWLIHAITADQSRAIEAHRESRKDPTSPPALSLPLWEHPEIEAMLLAWSQEHPFLGGVREVCRAWRSRRGVIAVCKYALQDVYHLEITPTHAESREPAETTRLPGDRAQLEAMGEAMAQVAGAKEVRQARKPPRRAMALPAR